MKERLEQRLTELTAEFEAGEKLLADLEARRSALRDTLLRLDGAITVLREELAATGPAGEEAAPELTPTNLNHAVDTMPGVR